MRRHLVPLAAVPLIAVSLIDAGCLAHPHPGAAPTSAAAPASSGVVAWLDAPTPPPAPPSPTPIATARPCTATDLPDSTTFEEVGGLSQAESDLIQLRNTGNSPCTLDAGTTLFYTDRNGQIRALPTEHGGLADSGAPAGPATIGPGQTATLLVAFSHGCPGNRVTYQGMILAQAGKRIPVPGLAIGGTCPTVQIGSWRAPEPAESVPPGLRFGTLSALLDAPASVRAGATLDYVVTLTNPGNSAVPLRPCPVYEETIYKEEATYLLNCAAGSIPAGGAIRFAMRITVPSYAPPGHARLSWTIVEPGGTSATASAPLEITA